MWNKVYPTDSTAVSGSTEQIRTNWQAIEDIVSTEHETFTTSATSGAHLPGRTGVLFYGTTAQISALSTPGTGALAWDSQRGTVNKYKSTGWTRLTSIKYSRVRMLLPSSISINNDTWTKLSFASSSSRNTYDSLSEYSTTNSRIVIKATGFYLITTSCHFQQASSHYQKVAAIYINGLLSTVNRTHGSHMRKTDICDVRHINANDYIEVYVWHNAGVSQEVISGNLHVTRLS